jgi:hypothetical protein
LTETAGGTCPVLFGQITIANSLGAIQDLFQKHISDFCTTGGVNRKSVMIEKQSGYAPRSIASGSEGAA